ncbi:MAG: LytR/AlgR family response regulator transcription factor [Aquabacterium sp.]
MTATALIADDEPLLREHLAAHLARAWPELRIVAQARNGREAVELFEIERPSVCFLDVHMPGMNGVDAARAIGGAAHIVFVTAFEQYAVQAFEQGAVDYLVKPFEVDRLDIAVQRLRQRLQPVTPTADIADPARLEALLRQLAERLGSGESSRTPVGERLQWIKASVGPAVKLIPVDEVAYLKSDEKYTLVAWSGGEALIRKPIRELLDELDPARFAQVHRSVIVNLHHVAQVVRGANETADVHLKGRPEVLPVSRSFLHLFRQM